MAVTMTERGPGTMTVTVGDETVTLDPRDPWPKFLADQQRMEALLRTVRDHGEGTQRDDEQIAERGK